MARPWHPRYHDDYARKTAHLSFAEHGAYALLMDQYYRTGEALPADRETLFRICRGGGAGERKALERVLNEFFEQRGDRQHNARADEELERANDLHEKRVKGGKARAHAQHMLSTCSESAQAQSQVRARTLQPQSHTQEDIESESSLEFVGSPSGKPKRPKAWDCDFKIPEDWFDAGRIARETRGLPLIDLALEADKFSDWAINAKPKKDWRAAFVNWCRNAKGVSYGTGFNGRGKPTTGDALRKIFRDIGDNSEHEV